MRNYHLTTIWVALACTVGTAACDRDEMPADIPEDKTQKAEGETGEPTVVAPGEQTFEQPPAAGEPNGKATCATAAANLVKLMEPEIEAQLQQIPEEQRAQAKAQMQAQLNVDEIAAQCEQQQPPQAELECVTNAKTTQDVEACQAPPPAGTTGEPPPPAGAPPPEEPPTPGAPGE